MQIVADETPEDVIESQAYELEALHEQVQTLEWVRQDAQALTDAARRTHDMEHTEPWMWCEVETCRLVREHDLG